MAPLRAIVKLLAYVVMVTIARCTGIPAATMAEQKVFDVASFGAKGDNTTINTDAFRAATAAAAAYVKASLDGVAMVRVSAPGAYLTGSFNLSSNTILQVQAGAEIRGVQSQNGSEYTVIAPLPSYGGSRDVKDGWLRHQALIMTDNAKNVCIEGGGVIDGNGAFWWALHRENKLKIGRPRLVRGRWWVYCMHVRRCDRSYIL